MTTPEKETHTPLPWAIDLANPEIVIRQSSDSYEYIVDCARAISQEEDAANAAFIVRAVNSHDALVEALEELVKGFDRFTGAPFYLPEELTVRARAALAAAKGDG